MTHEVSRAHDDDVCTTLAQLNDDAVRTMCGGATFRRELESHRGCGFCTGRILVILPPPPDPLCEGLAGLTDDRLETMFYNPTLGNGLLHHAEACGFCIDRIFRLRYRWQQKLNRGEAPRLTEKELWEIVYPLSKLREEE